jgi:hypothetical protein
MKTFVAVVLVGALAVQAFAQPAPCDACKRGDELIAKYSLEPLRGLAVELETMRLDNPVITNAQYAHVVDLRTRHPALTRLGALEDEDLKEVAIAVCRNASPACIEATGRALRCVADRCDVALPKDNKIDLPELPANCTKYTNRKKATPLGLGIDWGNGVHTSKHSTDGRAWSFGLETRLRLNRWLGVVARADRIAGKDEGTDEDGDGIDDMSTGSITRIMALGGPSFVLNNRRFTDTKHTIRLDLLGGYLTTRSQPNEDGPAAGINLAYQLWAVRFGVRFVQGFGDARDASTILGHVGFLTGASPPYGNESECVEATEHRSRLALGIDLPLGGIGLSDELGVLASGFGIEGLWKVTNRVDVMTRADLLVFPGADDKDRVIHQAAMAGLRVDHGKMRDRSTRTGFFSTVMAGYTHGAGFENMPGGSGAMTDVSFAWGGQGKEGAGYIRLHARFGLSPENYDYRVIFLSAGLELRLDPRTWRSRG